jgi:protein phosphatase 1 regulatory subunit 37
VFAEFIYFTYLARSIRLTQCLRVIHLELSNINGRILLMLAAALRDNQLIKELYLADNKMQPNDGQPLGNIIKENKCIEVFDLRNNHLQDVGLTHICSGLSEQTNSKLGLKSLNLSNNGITANGISYLSKALIHNHSLHCLNISNNTLTNEAIYELKDALIVNKQITELKLNKIKLSDEGAIALAEYLAETQSLRLLDIRENDIRLGGLMALASSLKFNKTLSLIEMDREPKREYSVNLFTV